MSGGDRRSPQSWLEWLVVAALIGAFALLLWKTPVPAGDAPISVGVQLPSFDTVSGWINAKDTATAIKPGKLTVVDFWATWCGPCQAELPKLIRVAQQYRPLGVQFISVTQETALDLDAIHRSIANSPGFDWPVAYGGYDVIAALQVAGYPTLVLFGPDGAAVWSHAGIGGADRLEAALDEAIAAMR